jgi:short-subunit dehydrogenase
MLETKGTALITGASAGLGAVFARKLAARGHRLVLVARRLDRLESLGKELHEAHGVECEAIAADLSRDADIARVQSRAERGDIGVLVNDAGFGTLGYFADLELQGQLDMVSVHVLSSMRLSRAVLPAMIAQDHGAIINVASIGAFIPTAHSVTYGATKSFLVMFSEGLAAELVRTRVLVQALCPGFTLTEFHDTSEFAKFDRSMVPRALWQTADEVVDASLAALGRKGATFVPGVANRAIVAFARSGFFDRVFQLVMSKKKEALDPRR